MKNKTSFVKGNISKNIKDEVGNVYFKLKVIKRVSNSKVGTARFLCKCDCGKEKIILGQSLRKGVTKSCGCDVFIRKRKGDGVFRKLYQSIKTNSNKKNIPFDLDLDFIKMITVKNCFYCKRPPYIEKFVYHKTRYSLGKETDESMKIHGIDKLIPALGYTKNNCVPCCIYCNRAKSDLTEKEFKELITNLYNNYAKIS
jgi:hypothetical protein